MIGRKPSGVIVEKSARKTLVVAVAGKAIGTSRRDVTTLSRNQGKGTPTARKNYSADLLIPSKAIPVTRRREDLVTPISLSSFEKQRRAAKKVVMPKLQNLPSKLPPFDGWTSRPKTKDFKAVVESRSEVSDDESME